MKNAVPAVLLAAVAVLVLAIAQAGEGIIDDGATLGPELLPQGDFEKGKDSPDGWDEVNDLSSYYVDRPGGKGKCLKFDSDVYPADVEKRAKEMELPRDKRPKAKPKKPTSGPKYDTIAGGSGALLWSDYFDVEHEATYRFVAEVNTYAPEAKLFIKGYALVEDERRIVYKKYLKCIPEDKNELGSWKFYSQDFTPQHPSYKIQWAKVEIMVFWPPGEAYIDNISIKKVLKEEEQEKPEPKEEKKKEETEKEGK
jgi:hypothetical protein